MRNRFIGIITLLAVVSLACTLSVNLPASTPGDLETFPVDEPLPEDQAQAEVHIVMGGGSLEINGGSSGLVTGSIEYNLAEWEPQVVRTGNELRIEQNVDTLPFPRRGSDIVNHWDLQLGSIPMELQVDAGAYEGTLDLSGLALTQLKINSGASNTEIRFDTPNPERMSLLEFRTGASNVELTGLGNANFAEMTFRGAAGNYTIDFSGEFQQPGRAVIDGAVGDMTIILPAAVPVEAVINGGLRNINTTGAWAVEDNVYTTGEGQPVLEITINMSVGNLELISE